MLRFGQGWTGRGSKKYVNCSKGKCCVAMVSNYGGNAWGCDWWEVWNDTIPGRVIGYDYGCLGWHEGAARGSTSPGSRFNRQGALLETKSPPPHPLLNPLWCLWFSVLVFVIYKLSPSIICLRHEILSHRFNDIKKITYAFPESIFPFEIKYRTKGFFPLVFSAG